MSAPQVAVIVLNYRGERVLRECLMSLEKTIGQHDSVLVVDNGNESSLILEMRNEFPWVETIATGSNRGFAAGMNFGLRQMLERGTFDAFWLMNNDARVEPETLNQLKQALEEKGGKALFAPLIFSPRAIQPWFSGGRIDFLRMRTKHNHNMPKDQDPYETGFLTGCALFIPRATIAEIGFLDERYFLYYEDAAYSLQALRKGFPLWVVPRSRVIHSEASRQNPTKSYWLVRSGVEFFLRESRGFWKIWVAIYFPLRRVKNWFDVRSPGQTVANEVKRAYTDVSL